MSTYTEPLKPSEAIGTQWGESIQPEIGVGGWFASWFVMGWFVSGTGTGGYTEALKPDTNWVED